MAKRLDGRKIANKLTQEQIEVVQQLKEQEITPQLTVISVGNDSASQIYIKQKRKRAEHLGIQFEEIHLPEDVSQAQLNQQIIDCNNDESINGVLLQLPLPNTLDEVEAMELLEANKDVDGFHVSHMGHLVYDDAMLLPCTPRGIMHLLKEYNIDPQGKHVVIVGRSRIVGLPLAIMMINHQATVSCANSLTNPLDELVRQGDIVIIATGQPHLIDASMIKEGAVIVDVGIHRTQDNRLIGDVNYEDVYDKVSAITPVPGGVGPLTVAMLMQQTLIATCLQHQLDPSRYLTL